MRVIPPLKEPPIKAVGAAPGSVQRPGDVPNDVVRPPGKARPKRPLLPVAHIRPEGDGHVKYPVVRRAGETQLVQNRLHIHEHPTGVKKGALVSFGRPGYLPPLPLR